ncbi:MAG TPA: amino acid adenylation domain-containing protein [Pseudonocardiaceae bacterium]|jgi:mycobactin phenyloxazoline synthetase|nr:amino acid adenylation domain-containing protein [Pseudonocardiaceae bacterium]
MVKADLKIDELQQVVASLLEEDVGTIGPAANLFTLGLDSIALMQLVGRWRQAGLEVNFAELAENPTIGAWSKLIADRPSDRAAGAGADARLDQEADAGAQTAFPLAVLQHAYWIGRADGARLGGVAAHLYSEFDGADVDPDRLRGAIQRLVARHDMLRVKITEDGWQRIETTSGWRGLTVRDLRDLDQAQVRTRLVAVRDTLSHQMLDIEGGEVLCTELSLLPGGRTRLHLDVDMVAADAVSYRILLADLARLYAQPDTTLPAVGYRYQEYRAACPAARRVATRAAAEWWQSRLPELPGAPELPLATGTHSGEGTGQVRVARRHFMLPAPEYAALVAASRRRGLTPAMAVATAFAEVLGAWSAQPRFLLNIPLFDRAPLHPDVDQLVGDFTSSVLLEVDLTDRVTFVERARRVQSRMHSDAAHADYSGVEVLRDLTRRSGHQVLAPVVFTSALSLGELFDAAVRRSFGDPVWIISQGPQVLLDAQITELDGGVLVNWDAREQELADGVVDAMFAAFERLVHRLADDAAWEEPVGELMPAPQRAVRDQVNDTACPRSGRLLHEGFFAASRRAPEAPALLWGKRSELSYRDLADRALRVAAALQARGVQPGDPVGITLPKGPDQAVAVLGVLAAGGGYVPVGVDQPAARAERIAQAAGFRVTIVEDPELAHSAGLAALTLPEALTATPLTAPVPGDEERLAYLLFTSGSTGEPKGVQVPHRAAMNTLDDLIERFGLGPADRTLAVSALDFDLSVFDLFAPLSVGGAVVLVRQDERRDAQHWAELIRERGVTVLNCVPALLDMVLTTGTDLGTSLRLVLLGGDWVGVELPGRLAAAVPGCRFAGLGGTTETAIHSTVCEVRSVPEGWRSVPYGTPLRNVCCRVVDHLGRDRPDWVPGELWIGGLGVAHGYQGDLVRTADRFVVREGRRWYRTGDLGRYWPDGTLEFLGRRDFQVKLRGHRIDLGEIEAVLAEHDAIRQAVVLVREDSPGARRLVGYVVPAAEHELDGRMLRAYAATRLPDYMVPAVIVVLTALPLTPNGKLDRRALPAPECAQPASAGPLTALQETLVGLFAEVLGVPSVGIDDSFFELGGDSIVAIQLVSRARTAGVIISQQQVLQHRTVRWLAEIAQPVTGTEAPREPDIGGGAVELTPIIRWLVERAPSFAHFSQAVGLNTPATLHADGLRDVVQAVLDRHDLLRSRLRRRGAEWSFEVVPPGTVDAQSLIRRIEVSGDWTSDRFAELLDEQFSTATSRLDPSAGTMLQLVWLDGGGTGGRLLVVAHHLVVDGVSWRILAADLAAAWAQVQAGRQPELAPVQTSFREWAKALAEQSRDPARVAELATWQGVLATPDPVLGSRRPDPQRDLYSTVQQVRVTLPTDTTTAVLTTVPAAFYAGVNHVLLAGLALAVARWRRDSGVGSVQVLLTAWGHGREQDAVPGAELSRTVGWFTSLFPLRLDLDGVQVTEAFEGGPAAGTALKRVKEQLRAVPANGLGFGLLRQLNPDTAAILAAAPAPQISFNYLGRFSVTGTDWAPAAEFGALRSCADPAMPVAASLEVNAITEEGPGGAQLSATWAFPVGVLTESEVCRLAGLWCDALRALVKHAIRPGSGGHTPSDLPLVSLSQGQLDALESRWRA